MPAPPTVRPALRNDATAIGECHAQAWRAAYPAIFPPGFLSQAVAYRRHNTGRRLVQKLVDEGRETLTDGSVLLIADLSETVVGFTHAGPSDDHSETLEIFAFYVHPNSWGSGIAQSLWAATLSYLRPHTSGPLVLWTLEGARRARRFYERNGWRPTGRTRAHDFGDEHTYPTVEYSGY